MRALFGFIDITDVEFMIAEGIRVSPDHREPALTAARTAAEALLLNTAAA